MRSLFAIVSFSLVGLLASGCQDGTSLAPARVALAQACAIVIDAEPVATKVTVIDTPAPGPVVVTPTPTPVPPEPTDPDDDTLPIACCKNGPCVDMDYPDDICEVLPVPTDATVITAYTTEVYTGTAVPTAIFGECEGDDDDEDDDDQCQPGDGAYVLSVGGAVAAVHFVTPTSIRVYNLGAAVSVMTPEGLDLHAVVAAGHTYADLARPVRRSGVLVGYLNKQTDCFPTACGYTCSIC